MQADDDNLRSRDPKWWANYRDHVERVAQEASQG
jgi:hypothetical protein